MLVPFLISCLMLCQGEIHFCARSKPFIDLIAIWSFIFPLAAFFHRTLFFPGSPSPLLLSSINISLLPLIGLFASRSVWSQILFIQLVHLAYAAGFVILCTSRLLGASSKSSSKHGFLKALLVCTVVYISLAHLAVISYSTTGDEPHYLMITNAILKDGSINQYRGYQDKDYQDFYWYELEPKPSDIVIKGEIRSQGLGVLFPLVLLPLFAVLGRLGATLTIAIISACAMAVYYRLYVKVIGEGRGSIIAWTAIAFTMPIGLLATQIYPETVAMLILGGMLALLLKHGSSNPTLKQILGATTIILLLALGLMVLKIRYAPVALTLVIGALIVLTHAQKRALRLYLLLTLIPLIGIIILGDLTLLKGDLIFKRFGAIYQLKNYLPDSSAIRGLFGLLFDQEAGLLIYSPVLGLVLVGMLLARLEYRHLDRIIKAAIVLGYFVYSCHPMWHSAPTPPGRYIGLLIPFGGLYLAALVKRYPAISSALFPPLMLLSSIILALSYCIPDVRANMADGTGVLFEIFDDGSRLAFTQVFPSFIRVNGIGIIMALLGIVLLGLFLVIRKKPCLDKYPLYLARSTCFLAIFSLVVIILFFAATLRQHVFEAEDKHDFYKNGGRIFPVKKDPYYHGESYYGWELQPGDWISLEIKPTKHPRRLVVFCKSPAKAEVLVKNNNQELGRFNSRYLFWQAGKIKLELGIAGKISIINSPGSVDSAIIDKVGIYTIGGIAYQIHRLMGRIAYGLHLYSPAKFFYQQCQLRSPDPAVFDDPLARVYYKTGDWGRLCEMYLRGYDIGALFKNNKEKLRFAIELLRGNAYKKVLEYIDSQNLAEKGAPLSYLLIGIAYGMEHRYQDCVNHFTRFRSMALDKNPHFNLRMLSLGELELKDLLQEKLDILKIDPGYVEAISAQTKQLKRKQQIAVGS